MNRLRDFMRQGKQQGKKRFVAYVTAGDPDLAMSFAIVKELASSGADIIELGVPFSDPIGDGPTNQQAAQRALRHNVSLRDVLQLTSRLRTAKVTCPIIIFTYFNPLFAMGLAPFAKEASAAGVDGVLTVDLPPEESGSYCALMREHGIDTVFLAAPTTTPERFARIDQASTGFVYYVSRTGVTGAQSALSATLKDEIDRARAMIQNPLVVGFGIATPEQARTVSTYADGVVVGSALVKIIETATDPSCMLRDLAALSSGIAAAIKGN